MQKLNKLRPNFTVGSVVVTNVPNWALRQQEAERDARCTGQRASGKRGTVIEEVSKHGQRFLVEHEDGTGSAIYSARHLELTLDL